MRYLIDATQTPPAQARGITAEGHDASQVSDVGLAQATDAAIWQHAADTAAVIVTKDEDFALRAQMKVGGPQVVWVRYGNVRKAELLRKLTAAWPEVADAVARGESLIELA